MDKSEVAKDVDGHHVAGTGMTTGKSEEAARAGARVIGRAGNRPGAWREGST